jgi:hypothetical protein
MGRWGVARRIYDFDSRLDVLLETLYRRRALPAPTASELAKLSGVHASVFSHAKKNGTLAAESLQRLGDVGIDPRYFLSKTIGHVTSYLAPPEPTNASAAGVSRLPVRAGLTAQELRLVLIDVALERQEHPNVGRALLRVRPPAGREDDLVWWIGAYLDAREAGGE